MINVFIGYDSKEKVAFNTLSYSILKNSTKPVAITPIYLNNIKSLYLKKYKSERAHSRLLLQKKSCKCKFF